jgi:hypothetical protein
MDKRVVLCGASILIGGLANSLSDVEGFDVIQSDLADLPELLDRSPDIVIVDLGDANATRAVAQSCSRPGVLVLGVDANRSVLTVLSGSQMSVSDTDDLTHLIKRFVRSSQRKTV